jgi:6-phosphofructokinase 1
MEIRRIALATGGGDAPGLNAVLRAAVVSAIHRGWECVGVRDGYNGLLVPEQYPDGGLIRLDRESVRGITHLGGTILGTTNRGNPCKYPVTAADGTVTLVDRTQELVDRFHDAGIDALITAGGDGSMGIAHALAEKGLRLVGVPKTIDNDLVGTAATFGFDTAVDFATDSIDRLHSTAESHRRIMVVEVMGRYAGWIALHAGLAGTADVILIPEIPYDIEIVAEAMRRRYESGRRFAIVVVAEGAKPVAGDVAVVAREAGRADRLGGAGERVAQELERLTGFEARTVVLGHLQRGGRPTSLDRNLGLNFGAAAVRALAMGLTDVMVAYDPPHVRFVPLAEISGRMKLVPLDSGLLQTAREVGICLGD